MINVSLPSLRADNFPKELMEKLNEVRRSGLTFAPEAGTQRLRDVINKNITEEEILSTSRKAFQGGWTAVKLYFMLGLPEETDEDIVGIATLPQGCKQFYNNPDKPKGGVTVSVGISTSSQTLHLQWEPFCSLDEIERKQASKGIRQNQKASLSFHSLK